MTEIILGIVIAALLVMQAVTAYIANKHIEELTKALIAKSLTEMSTAKMIEKQPVDTEEVLPEMMPVDNMSDSEFNNLIKRQLERGSNVDVDEQ